MKKALPKNAVNRYRIAIESDAIFARQPYMNQPK